MVAQLKVAGPTEPAEKKMKKKQNEQTVRQQQQQKKMYGKWPAIAAT